MVLLSKASTTPAALSIARYPPPDTAIPILGSALALFLLSSMYESVSKPLIFILDSRSFIGSTVAFRRASSHCVSFWDNVPPVRMVGVAEGQSTVWGV